MDRNALAGEPPARIGEGTARELLDALVERRSLRRGSLEVEVRDSATGRHPLSGDVIHGAPVAVLWDRERLLGVLVDHALALSRFAGDPRSRWLLGRSAERAGLAVVPTGESALWRLLGKQRSD